jgi:hypothetical protein
MGRKGWRASRALRVFLACLALWLPARSASAWMAPPDMVMVAGAARAVTVESTPSDAQAEANHGRAWRRSVRQVPAPPLVANSSKRAALRGMATARPPAAPLYLLHCVLLR